jgi:hypothetical protein
VAWCHWLIPVRPDLLPEPLDLKGIWWSGLFHTDSDKWLDLGCWILIWRIREDLRGPHLGFPDTRRKSRRRQLGSERWWRSSGFCGTARMRWRADDDGDLENKNGALDCFQNGGMRTARGVRCAGELRVLGLLRVRTNRGHQGMRQVIGTRMGPERGGGVPAVRRIRRITVAEVRCSGEESLSIWRWISGRTKGRWERRVRGFYRLG